MKLIKLYVLSLTWLLSIGMAGVGACETVDYSRFISLMAGGHVFEGDQNLEDNATLGLGMGAEFGRRFGWEAMLNLTDTETDPGSMDVDVYTYRLNGFYNLLNDARVIPYVSAGVGGMFSKADDFKDDDFMVNYGAGLKYYPQEDIALRLDAAHIVSFNDSYNNLLITVGLTYYFGRETSTPGIRTTASSCAEEFASPAPMDIGPEDADGDGVIDALDICPDTPAGVAVDVSGCPLDSDGDGVSDYLDECPNTPKGVDVTDKGCWEIRGILFETDKWDIIPSFYPELDKVVDVLREDPALELEIHGHCDIRGPEAYNQNLSEKRAAAVVSYIISKGISAERLQSRGFGFHKPIAPNDTPENMAKNRRVEAKQVKISIAY